MSANMKLTTKGAIIGALSGMLITGGTVAVLDASNYEFINNQNKQQMAEQQSFDIAPSFEALEKLKEDTTFEIDLNIQKQISEHFEVDLSAPTAKDNEKPDNTIYKIAMPILGAIGGCALGHRFVEMYEYEKALTERLKKQSSDHNEQEMEN